MKPIFLGFWLFFAAFPFIFDDLAHSSEQMQALTTKSVKDVYEKSKKAGFKRGAMGSISEKAIGEYQKNAQTQRTQEYKKAYKEWHRKAKPIVRPKTAQGKEQKAADPADSGESLPRPARRSGSAPTTGGMSAGASKGAEAINFGSKKKE